MAQLLPLGGRMKTELAIAVGFVLGVVLAGCLIWYWVAMW